MKATLLNSDYTERSVVEDIDHQLRDALWSPAADTRHSLVSPGGSIRPEKSTTKQGTTKTSVFNLANTILGSGTLACPYACKLLGVGGFIFLMVFSALLADYAIRILFVSVDTLKVERPRYPTLGRRTMGSFGEYFSSMVVTLQQCGACIGYMVIIGDVLQPIIALTGYEWACHRWIIQLFLLVSVIFPLCLLPTMSSLKYVSFASLVLIWSAVLAIVINGFLVIENPDRRQELLHPTAGSFIDVCNTSSASPSSTSNITFTPSSSTSITSVEHMRMFPESIGDVLAALPIISFAFLCHQNTFPIYKELKDASPNKMAIVGHYSIAICCFVYIMSGLMGYYTFLEDTESDLLRNFRVTGTYYSGVMDVVRTGFGISCVLSYPLMVWEARHNLDVLIFGIRPYEFWRNFGLNVGILGVCGAIGMTVKDLDVVLGFVGSTCSPVMVFVLPALFYLVPSKKSCCRCVNIKAIFMLLWGLFLIPACLFVWSLSNFVCKKGEESSASHELCVTFGF
jgi:amino acid permease